MPFNLIHMPEPEHLFDQKSFPKLNKRRYDPFRLQLVVSSSTLAFAMPGNGNFSKDLVDNESEAYLLSNFHSEKVAILASLFE